MAGLIQLDPNGALHCSAALIEVPLCPSYILSGLAPVSAIASLVAAVLASVC